MRNDCKLLLLLCALAAVVPARAQITQTVLYNFGSPAKGAYPAYSGVVRDAKGNLYGTTQSGGASNAGVVYKVSSSGRETVLYSFTGGADGGQPYPGVIRDSAGNLYGTTAFGGAQSAGTVYKVDSAGNETVLYSFTGGADGGYPNGGVIRDSAGNLYGTATSGGTAGAGVVFKLDMSGHETVLFSFTDGGYPFSNLIRDGAGNLYGITLAGGPSGNGVVYKVSASGHETDLYSFTGGADGQYPYAGVFRDPAGNLYGTTQAGGTANAGVVYKLDASGHETVLYNFTGGADGAGPVGGVLRDSAGNLYGTTAGGGSQGAGVVYKLDSSNHETVLYNFTGGADGANPQSSLIRDSSGTLYGTTYFGGPVGAGGVFQVRAAGAESVLCGFSTVANGYQPVSGLVRDGAGNLYGTAFYGGTANVGVVFKLNASGRQTVLHSFTGPGDGQGPDRGPLVRDSSGNLYGTTVGEGPGGYGTVFKLDKAGNETILYSFTGGADGGNPRSGVVVDSAGSVYGTTSAGGAVTGAAGFGVVYKVDSTGHESVLYTFLGGTDGSLPAGGGVVRDAAGNLYGTTTTGGAAGHGTVYKVDPSGHETILYSFSGAADGGGPQSGVILDAAGNLYGTASGNAGHGVVFKVDPSGHETVLYAFMGGTDGISPRAAPIRDAAGNLYGTTQGGGTSGHGVVYKVDSTGHETVLYNFTGGADGGDPLYAGVIQDPAGNLYGTTGQGGAHNTGVVYKLSGLAAAAR